VLLVIIPFMLCLLLLVLNINVNLAGKNIRSFYVRNFDKELSLVTQAWGKVFVPGKLYIAMLDFKDGPDVFRKASD
jgi:hypothetical protein